MSVLLQVWFQESLNLSVYLIIIFVKFVHLFALFYGAIIHSYVVDL